MKKSIIYIVLLQIALFLSCSEDEKKPLVNDSAPLPVKNIQVENLPGGAKLSYELPNDENLLYVKAVYTTGGNKEKVTKASYYQNFLLLDGFTSTKETKVEVYTVSRGEIQSEAVTATVNPLTPPFVGVFESIKISPTFGGIRIDFENKSEANVKFTILAQNEDNEFVPVDAYYTKRSGGLFNIRGFEAEPQTFGVFVRDRWNNHSDTLFNIITPIFELKFDKSKFAHIKLPSDTYEGHVSSAVQNLWDGKTSSGGENIFHSKPGTGLPQWFTFDLGVKATLSRMNTLHRSNSDNGPYVSSDAQVYEIWGSLNPNSDGSWDNWSLLMTCNSFKPSGYPIGSISAEDWQYATVDGEDFDFPPDIPVVRYIRVKTLKTWGGLDHMHYGEFTFWGDIVE